MEEATISSQYQPYILKRYEYLTLLLNEHQRYLGRAVAWLSRPGDMQRFSGLWAGELVELQLITREYESVLDRVGWKPDHINYSMLGNFFHEHSGHGHMHIIPRYAPRPQALSFASITFEDDRWGKNCTPETPMNVPHDVITAITAVLRDELEKKN